MLNSIQNLTFLKGNTRSNRIFWSPRSRSCTRESSHEGKTSATIIETTGRHEQTSYVPGQRVYVRKRGRWGNVVGRFVFQGIVGYQIQLSPCRNCSSETIAATSAELEAL